MRNIIWKRNIQPRHQWHCHLHHPHHQGHTAEAGLQQQVGGEGGVQRQKSRRSRCHHGGTKNKQTILIITMVRELCLDHGSHGGSIHHGDGAIRGAIRSLAHHLPLMLCFYNKLQQTKCTFYNINTCCPQNTSTTNKFVMREIGALFTISFLAVFYCT